MEAVDGDDTDDERKQRTVVFHSRMKKTQQIISCVCVRACVRVCVCVCVRCRLYLLVYCPWMD